MEFVHTISIIWDNTKALQESGTKEFSFTPAGNDIKCWKTVQQFLKQLSINFIQKYLLEFT